MQWGKMCDNCLGMKFRFRMKDGKPNWNKCPECDGTGNTARRVSTNDTIQMHSWNRQGSGSSHVFQESEWKDKTLAHIMHHIGAFKSISEARKNGWNRPVTKGQFHLKKRKIEVRIV